MTNVPTSAEAARCGSCHSALAPTGEYRTAESLAILRDVLLAEEWFEVRPPLALAFAHPAARLYCETWRTQCVGDLRHCDSTALSLCQGSPSRLSAEKEGDDVVDGAARGPFFVQIGPSQKLRNPLSSGEPSVDGTAGIHRPAMTTPACIFAHSPFAPLHQQDVRSLVPPLTTVDTAASLRRDRGDGFRPGPVAHSTLVVDPSVPLYHRETYAERIFRLPIGMKLGHVRILTVPTTDLAGDGEDGDGGYARRLVRGLFTYVPSQLSLRAANHAGMALTAAIGRSKRLAAEARSSAAAVAERANAPFVEPDNDVDSSESTATANEAPGESTPRATEAAEGEDDWEAAALQEEAQLDDEPRAVVKAGGSAGRGQAEKTTTSPETAGTQKSRAKAQKLSLPLAPAAPSSRDPQPPSDPPHHKPTTAVPAYTPLEGVSVALPPPTAWWLCRSMSAASPRTPHGSRLPLYAHCVDATASWMEWLESLSSHPDTAAAGPASAAAVAPAAASPRFPLRGVSLSGWSYTYLPPAVIPTASAAAEFAKLPLTCRLETILPHSPLPLRGLHIEFTILALKTLLSLNDMWSLPAPLPQPPPWHTSLVALDIPHVRDVDMGAAALPPRSRPQHPEQLPLSAGKQDAQRGDAGDDGVAVASLPPPLPPHGFAAVLRRLPALRYLLFSHGTGLTKDLSGSDGNERATEDAWCPLEELSAQGVLDLDTSALATVGLCCPHLRLLDLTSTRITDDDLDMLVRGTRLPASGRASTQRGTPLVQLEELRLAGCHFITRVHVLPLLPHLRRLVLRSSRVRDLRDLDGCNALEELTLTRCKHVTELYPLWRLPRLRCVEADAVRQLLPMTGILPHPLPSQTHTHADGQNGEFFNPAAMPTEDGVDWADVCAHDATVFAAPLVRLNLCQSTFVYGNVLGFLACRLHEAVRQQLHHSLRVLLLDHTAVDNVSLEALAGVSQRDEPAGVARAPAATGLCEISLIGCLAVQQLGPLGLLPNLRSVVADGAGVEGVEGLEQSRSLVSLSLAHCARLWAIAPLARIPSLRVLDVSQTPLKDAGLLRFVFPDLVEQLIEGQSLPADMAADAPVPSQVEELRLYQCVMLKYIGCVAHLPRLRRLDASSTATFDRGFVSFFARAPVLLRTQLWAAAHPAAMWSDEEGDLHDHWGNVEMAGAPVPDEAALLRAWRGLAAGANAAQLANATNDPARVHSDDEFVFSSGAKRTLTHLSFVYSAEVRCITPFALFDRLTVLDLTGTGVDSAALLSFVNLLHECCAMGEGERSGEPARRLEMAEDGLLANVNHSTLGHRRRRPYTLTSLKMAFCYYLTDVRCCASIPSLLHLTVSGAEIENNSVAAFGMPPCTQAVAAAGSTSPEFRWWHRHHCALHTLDVKYCHCVSDVSAVLLPPSPCASSLRELLLTNTEVSATKEDLRALNPHSSCVFKL